MRHTQERLLLGTSATTYAVWGDTAMRSVDVDTIDRDVSTLEGAQCTCAAEET